MWSHGEGQCNRCWPAFLGTKQKPCVHRDASDTDHVRGCLHAQSVHLPVCQLLLTHLYCLLQGQVSGCPPHWPPLPTSFGLPSLCGMLSARCKCTGQGKALSRQGLHLGRHGQAVSQVCASPRSGLRAREEGRDCQNLVTHRLTTWIPLGLWDTQATTTLCLESVMKR